MAGLLSPTLESQFAGSCTLVCADPMSMELLLGCTQTPPGVHSIIKAAETERAQVHEAHAARDVVVSLLATVTRSVQEKTSQISQLQDEKSRLHDALTALQQPADDKNKLHPTNLAQRPTGHGKPLSISTASFGVHGAQTLLTPPITPTESNGAGSACKNAQPSSVSSRSGDESVNGSNSSFNAIQDESSLDPDDTIKARHAALASFPVPVGIPDDELKPISLPPHITMQEFLSDLPTALSVSLSNYRILQEVTTHWCPEREEHGYYLSPLFKCSTNSRFATAHNWIKADVVGSLSKPTECFYLRGGQWYYAGAYVAVRLTDLTSQEWDHLSTESAQAILKDTLAERKNVAPQHLYEVAQLYAAGALRVACVGLKCIGFNASLYHSLLEHATRTGRTSRQWSNPVPRESLGSESPMSMLSPTATPFDSPRLFSLAVHGTTANSHHGGAA